MLSTNLMTAEFRNFIGGQWTAPCDGHYFDNRNPADTSDIVGRFPLSSEADVDRMWATCWRRAKRKLPA